MPQLVEISLRIPSIRAIRDGKDSPTTIANINVDEIMGVIPGA